MSYYTSLVFYRPAKPPAITASDLGRFIARIHDEGLLVDDGLRVLQLKLGDSIDQDEKRATCLEELEHAPGLFVTKDIEWDLELRAPTTIADMIAGLANDNRRIYRAVALLGSPIDAVLNPITRTNSPENDVSFCPDTLGIDIGPINIGGLAADHPPLFVGWIGVSLSGSGYLFPWTSRDVLKRLEGKEPIQQLMEVCRSTWPVPPRELENRFIDMRRDIGDHWPYDELSKPWDWYWGFDESG